MNQNKAPLLEALLSHIAEHPTPFHMPGHKLGVGLDTAFRNFAGANIFKADLSELQGLGNLHGHVGAIAEAERLAAEVWGAKTTHFLVGGTSSGITASLCTILKEGDKIFLPRNAHTSAYYGLVMSGAEPIWLRPKIEETSGMVTNVAPEQLADAFGQHPSVKAVFAVSPTYLGVMSDMKTLADITHAHGAVLIADEAHGSHLYFHEDFPKGALTLGADIVCQSTHKTGGSLTQSSMIHLGKTASDSIDLEHLRENLAMVQSTSPSYLLMASLDAARRNLALHGHALLDVLLQKIRDTKKKIKALPGIVLLDNVLAGEFGNHTMDPFHLSISAQNLGFSGKDLYVHLREKYHIEAEYAEKDYVLFLLGIGTRSEDFDRLVAALEDIVANRQIALTSPTPGKHHPVEIAHDVTQLPIPKQVLSPREAWFAKKKTVRKEQATGKICAEIIMTYPPGIPLVCPGEMLSADVMEILDSLHPDLSFFRVVV